MENISVHILVYKLRGIGLKKLRYLFLYSFIYQISESITLLPHLNVPAGIPFCFAR